MYTPPRSAQVPALDGIRGIAVALVVWLHLRPHQMPGGWVGMSVFFPLSGFLMTRLILNERISTGGRVGLGRFWVRRGRRLLPAHYVMLLVVVALLVAGGTWEASDRGAVMSSLLYSNNWWQLAHSVDYWSEFSGRVSPFQHLWSLSVEEQFYVLWPIITVVTLRFARRPLRTVGMVACGLAGLGAIYGLAITRLDWGSTTDVYYNTGVRGAELLAGSALAILLAARPALWSSEWARSVLNFIAATSLGAIAVLSLTLDDEASRFIADGGMFATGLATTAIVAAAVRGGGAAGVLAWAPLRWLGTRCYSLYLWHWPIIALVTRESSGLDRWWLTAAQLTLTAAATVVSYRLVEDPFRRGVRASIARWSRNTVPA